MCSTAPIHWSSVSQFHFLTKTPRPDTSFPRHGTAIHDGKHIHSGEVFVSVHVCICVSPQQTCRLIVFSNLSICSYHRAGFLMNTNQMVSIHRLTHSRHFICSSFRFYQKMELGSIYRALSLCQVLEQRSYITVLSHLKVQQAFEYYRPLLKICT